MGSVGITQGNIFDSKCEVLVCPVNCDGVMGAGLAKQFAEKEKYSDMVRYYKELCYEFNFHVGTLWLWKDTVLLFPTKLHWQDSSKYSYIEEGLQDFVTKFKHGSLGKSFAFPMLGCGLGGLEKVKVAALFQKYLIPDKLNVDVEIYAKE